jgi:hypothetical protein
MDDQELNCRKRFTPWIILLEIMMFGFGDDGTLRLFSPVGGVKRRHKEATKVPFKSPLALCSLPPG